MQKFGSPCNASPAERYQKMTKDLKKTELKKSFSIEDPTNRAITFKQR